MTLVLTPGQRHEAVGFEALMEAGAVKRYGPGRPKRRPHRVVEPLCGSAAMLLCRPEVLGTETINDVDGFVTNAYRGIRVNSAEVVQWCDWPVSECDLHARHAWLVRQREALTARLEGNPDYFDAKIAGWWIWGACCWIGSGWCSGRGPWQVLDGKLVLRFRHKLQCRVMSLYFARMSWWVPMPGGRSLSLTPTRSEYSAR
jgi:hypothetical protein